MEKASSNYSSVSINSSKYIGATLDNVILNSDINLSKIKELVNSLDKAAKAIIIPILKIQKKISMKFDIFSKDYNEIIEKAEQANKEISSHSEESKCDSMNITDIQLNQKYANNHENMINFYDNITNKIDLFTKLFSSNEYENLLKGFNKLINDEELFISEQNEQKEEKEILDQIVKENIKLKKPIKKKKKPVSNNSSNNNNNSTINNNKKKSKKNLKKKNIKRLGQSFSRRHPKRKRDVDLLEMLQKQFPSNNYVKKISKTFISRRLFKKVIYRHIFEYNLDESITENKLRSSGESTIYKYGKMIFKFINEEIKKEITDRLDEFVGKELRQQFVLIDEEKKEYIIAGKISSLINKFIEKVFKVNLRREFKVEKVTLEFYEFYEELVSEFDEREKNVRIVLCDENILKGLRSDWINLEIVREYIKKVKEGENSKIKGDKK